MQILQVMGRHMNIKALRAFRATITEGSLAGAARIVHLSQPAVSRLISGLEGELRLNLFERSGRRLVPTREGLAFFREAGRILDNLDEVPRIAADIRAGRSEMLRVVAMPRIARAIISPAIAALVAADPDTRVSLDIRARREAGKWLAGREYDIGVGALPVDHPEIETELLLRVRAQALIPADWPLADRSSVTADALADVPIIRLLPGLLLREQLDDFFRSAGVVPREICEVASSELACALACDGVGVTIADELVASQVAGGSARLVPIEPERWMSFGVLLPRRRSALPSRDRLMACLRDHAARLSAESKTIALA